MTLVEFLLKETWAVYQVDGANRRYFGDTAFGPMWKDFPEVVEVPSDLTLPDLKSVQDYMTASQSKRVVQKIPYDGPDRVETGPVQFGDDWPGLFIRGDSAFGLAMSIHEVLSYFEAYKPAGSEDIYFALSSLRYLHETILNDVVVKSEKKDEQPTSDA